MAGISPYTLRYSSPSKNCFRVVKLLFGVSSCDEHLFNVVTARLLLKSGAASMLEPQSCFNPSLMEALHTVSWSLCTCVYSLPAKPRHVLACVL